MKKPMILDIEIYPNYALFAFRKEGELFLFDTWDKFSSKDIKAMKKLLVKNLIVTFNGNHFDMPIVNYALLRNATVEQMRGASKAIIEDKINVFQVYKKMGLRREDLIDCDHIDLIEPAPAINTSLKAYGTRLGTQKLWELPFDPHLPLTKKQAKTIRDYCENDLIVTTELFDAIEDRLELRINMSEEYGIDLRSKSDAQIAEAVMVSELDKLGIKAERPRLPENYRCKYKAPDYIKFKSPQLKKLLKRIKKIEFGLDNGGSVQLPASLTQELITINKTTYKLGIGGLHSQEKCMTVTTPMKNADFASYYPFILIMNKYYPKHLGKAFLKIYKKLVDTRIEAKGRGDKTVADGLKIAINGLFGKLGSKWSKVYSPDLMLQITMTGQLTLLMLIEQFEEKGITVVSCNTDGLEYTGKKSHKAEKIIKKLEDKTGYTMEIGSYISLHARDVNNYVAKYDGYVKAKGVYADPLLPENFLKKNSQTPIVFEAVREFINSGKPMEKTIKKCKDIRMFLTARAVRGGAMFGGDIPEMYPEGWHEQLARPRGLTKKIQKERERMEALWVKDNGSYLGKIARWYYSVDGKSIHYKSNGNLVPKSEGAMPMMDIPNKFPKDLDLQWYYREADQMLRDLGVVVVEDEYQA